MDSFQQLQLPESIGRALTAMGYKTPTPIQSKAIPIALNKRDLIACAETGTGKTAAFCIPVLMRLHKSPNHTGLILVPTRELAQQIEASWRGYAKNHPEMSSAVLIGGMSMQPQMRMLSRKPRLIIATPGRLADHLNRGSLSLSKTEILVLDEADRMLDMGFAAQLRQILRFLPKVRQTLLFSATWNTEMDRLSAQYLKDPERVAVGTTNRAAPKISQFCIQTTSAAKNDALLDEIIKTSGPVLVFARTKSRTDRVGQYLQSYGLKVDRIHGGRSQGQRTSALAGFKAGKVRILCATDIAARGIDVQGISHVINYDLPRAAEDYVHRIGRTARAGASGSAISFVTPEERGQWNSILRLLRSSGSQAPEMRLAGKAAGVERPEQVSTPRTAGVSPIRPVISPVRVAGHSRPMPVQSGQPQRGSDRPWQSKKPRINPRMQRPMGRGPRHRDQWDRQT